MQRAPATDLGLRCNSQQCVGEAVLGRVDDAIKIGGGTGEMVRRRLKGGGGAGFAD
jgi:hypothetical protein